MAPVRPSKEGGPQARRTPMAKIAGPLPPGQTRHNVQRFLGRGGGTDPSLESQDDLVKDPFPYFQKALSNC